MQKHDFGSLPRLSIQVQEIRNISFTLAILTDLKSLAVLMMICFIARIGVGSGNTDDRAMHGSMSSAQ